MKQARPGYIMPKTPPRLDTQNVLPPYSPTSGTPVMTPKAPDLRSVASMPSLQSFNSVQSFQSHIDLNDFDVFDFAHFNNDAIYNDLDQLQTPDIDPLSPTFYDLHGQASPLQHPLLTPELSASVGSGTSLSGGSQLNIASAAGVSAGTSHSQHANLMANNIEGLGIAENRPRAAHLQPMDGQAQQWSGFPSPEHTMRRSKAVGPPRVTKKPSKQLLKQRKSRTNLVSEAAAAANPIPTAKRSSSPAVAATAQPPSIRQSPKIVSQASADFAQAPYVLPQKLLPAPGDQRVISPNTPYKSNVEVARLRGKAAASPAMQSPMRPGQETRLVNGLPPRPRLQAAAAATALYTPASQQANSPRNSSMAAAAAAAAAVASRQQPITPMADRQTLRNSPSTIIMSAPSGDSTIKSKQAAAPSPTPAARIHSNSRLVASASDSSPAKGMWKPANRAPIPPANLPKPILSPRKSASTSNMRRETRRKQTKIIPEMSSSLNQFQVDLKPKQRTSKTSLGSSQPTRTAQPAPSFFNNQMLPQFQQQQRPPHPQQQQPFNYPQKAPPYYAFNQEVGPGLLNNNMPNLGPNMRPGMAPNMGSNMGTNMGSNMAPNMAPSMHNLGRPMPPSRHSLPPPGPQGQIMAPPDMMMLGQGPMTQMPELARRSASFGHAPLGGQSQVQPQGEPPQHVWASRPQPQRTPRRHHPGAQLPPRTQSAGANIQMERMNRMDQQMSRHMDRQMEASQFQLFNEMPQGEMPQGEMPHGEMPQGEMPLYEPRAMMPTQSAPAAGVGEAPANLSRHSMPDLGQGLEDTSLTSDFMAQFINDDAWDSNEDMGTQWEFMDALEPQLE